MYMFTPPVQVSFLNALAVQIPLEDRQTDTTSFTVALYPQISYDTSPGSRPEEEKEREKERKKGGRGRRKREKEEGG